MVRLPGYQAAQEWLFRALTDNRQMMLEFFDGKSEDLNALLNKLNSEVYNALELRSRERALVNDLVRVRLELDDGRVGPAATGKPSVDQMQRYARRLGTELDSFLGESSAKRCRVDVLFADTMGMVRTTIEDTEASAPTVCSAGSSESRDLEAIRRRLRKQHAQWVYFDRSLQVYEGRSTLLFKPLQAFHWAESEAMRNAAEIISQTLAGEGQTFD